MIIRTDKTYETNTVFLDTDWYNEGNFIIDETTEEGQQMAQTVIDNYPFIDFESDGEFVTKVIVLDKPVKPPEIEGKEIRLIKDETGQWVYEYVDRPLTEIEELKQQLAEQQQLIDAMLGVSE